MRAFFIGDNSDLYAFLHRSETETEQSRGVVLCPPIGFEYFRSHRAFVQLGRRLAQAGHPTLRFDYYGCGDSAGEDFDATLERWIGDIGAAVEALRRHAGSRPIYLVGRGVGAALALMQAQHSPTVEGVVLWDPVVSGADYCSWLADFNERFLDRFHGRGSRSLRSRVSQSAVPEGQVEILGSRWSKTHWAALEAIDLEALKPEPRLAVSLIESVGGDLEPLSRHLERNGVRVRYRRLPEPADENLDELLLQVVPESVLEMIQNWMSDPT